MKIAMLYPAESSEIAISKYAQNLIKSMKKKKIQVDPIEFIAGSPGSFLNLLDKLDKYDIIHVQHEYNLLGHYGSPWFFILPLLKATTKAKIVITMHTALSLKEKFEGSALKNFLRKSLYFLQNRWINYFSNRIVLHGPQFRNALVNEYGVPKKKTIIIPQGIIETVKKTPKAKAKKKLGLKGNVYLIIGSLKYDNASDIVLKQAGEIGKTIVVATNPKALNDRNPEKMKQWLDFNQEIVRKNNFEKFVRFDFRELPDDLWWTYFSAADIVLSPYRGGIGSGIFADAMAAGKPVVTSNIEYFRWIAKDFGCIKIAKKHSDYGKVIKEAIKPKNYKKMQSECKRYLKERGLSAIADKYKKFYNSLK
ncbi:glycosyltransferase family 4 protein [Nanoarchaeota archaeon]